ncbi:MAG: Ig-like domain-containing protein, partial [Treponemataceae bacterium]|nr:Ig-like domain-containing protein [Treponemataceae bacterium]
MKQTMQKIAIALCMALAFAACKNDDPETGGGVESVTIEPTTLALEIGKNATLQAKINGVNSTEVKWSSDKTGIATVDSNGKVTAVSAGTATITATAKADTTKKAACTVTVTKADIAVTLDPPELTLGIGEDTTLQAKINGVNSTEVKWSSDKTNVATVINGKVTAVSAGTATITATAKTDASKKATCTVKVEDAGIVQPSGITVAPTSLSLKVGDTKQINATITNEDNLDAEHKKITWCSENENIATVNDDGLVSAVSVGETTITAKTTNGKDATCAVTVTEAVNVTLDSAELSLEVDETETLVPTITGTDSKAVTWKSSDETVATVDSNGKVTAKKKGAATITVTLTADKTKTAMCDVTVVEKDEVMPDGVTLNKNNLSLKIGSTETLTATITNTTDVKNEYKTITWTSSDEKVATVDKNGKVTAIDAGTATITATTQNEKKATCTVTVTAQTTTPVTVSEDEWNFVGKTDAPYSNLGTPKTSGTGKDAQALDGDISVKGEKNQLTLVLSKASTGVGESKTNTPMYKYDDTKGLCIKSAALKIDGIKGSVTATIKWYLNTSNSRNLEVTVGNGNPISTPSGTTSGDKDPYTVDFDGGNGTTLYIGASNELFIKSITITPQSGGGTVTPNPDPDPTPDPAGKTISLTDTPLGYASLGTSYKTSGGKTVTNRADLLSAIKSGGVIIINGMIDMSEGKLPAAGGKSTDSTSELDALVHNTYNKYANYAAWVKAYSEACSLTTDDDKSGSGNSALQAEVAALNKAYGDLIKLTLKSGTTLIGKGPNCGIRGGTIQISSASNIQIRNLTIQDAFDPFPHHEKNDGYNAQWDGINIQGTCENIWIDHVTFEDTMTLDYVYTQSIQDEDHHEKWQTYDGLCDMKNDSTNITISNCIFRNHDKTMLIGSSDSDGDNTKRFITLQGNYFYNCGQRLPMVRNTTIHILNNYYDADSNPRYKQQYAVGCRKDSIIYAEANYFGSGIYYSFKDNDGKLYSANDTDKASKGKTTNTSGTTLFSTAVKAYSYTPVTAEQAKTTATSSAGAGYTL